jgi:bifunctional ADP-heptose synthase (sugar kinase/adenylyltransferase)
MLTSALIEKILASLPNRTIGVLGDLFLDRYLDLDAALTEPSIETGLDAYQVVKVRSDPGAAGTVINNLAALGVGRIVPISMIGDDGEGYELRQALQRMPSVQLANVLLSSQRRTPTYTKPMLWRAMPTRSPGADHAEEQLGVGMPLPRELNRLDIKNRQPLPPEVERQILEMVSTTWASLDTLLILDQVSEPECGVVTARVRDRLMELGGRDAGKIAIVDSRERIGLFRNLWLKPNERECLRSVGQANDLRGALKCLVQRAGRPVICTQGQNGMLVGWPEQTEPDEVPAYPVRGPIDTVGAGDSSSAALACALASGANLIEAAAFGNVIAWITIQKIGTTGTATPDEVRKAARELMLGE